MKNYNTMINLNKFLSDIKIKKKYIKKLNSIDSLLNNVKEKDYKKLNYNLSTKSDTITNQKDSFIMYIIDISFSKTNTLLHVMDFAGNLKFSYSAGLFKYKGKNKKLRFLVLRDFYHVLVTKLKFLKFKPIALHLKNVGHNKFWIIKKLKKKFFIKTIKNYSLYPYNGCRKKKMRRRKFKSRRRDG